MEVGTSAATLIITAMIVLTGQQNGFVSASTSSMVPMSESSTTMIQPTTAAAVSIITTTASAANAESSTTMNQPTTAAAGSIITTTASAANAESSTTMIQSTTAAAVSIITTTASAAKPDRATTGAEKTTAPPELFHVTMIVMIVVLGFIITFSVSCGLCVIFGIDVGCPIPCCGGGGKAKNPAISASGMKLKRSSRPGRISSSQRLHDVEEFPDVECKGIKSHGSANGQDNMVYEF